jgi:hypothetical protein
MKTKRDKDNDNENQNENQNDSENQNKNKKTNNKNNIDNESNSKYKRFAYYQRKGTTKTECFEVHDDDSNVSISFLACFFAGKAN